MKLPCSCGTVIIDTTDDLPHKGHLILDQEWFATYDALDDQVIDPLADGRVSRETAHHQSRLILNRAARMAYQCGECGRLYVEGSDGRFRCFVPEDQPSAREVLRSRPRHAEPGASSDPASKVVP